MVTLDARETSDPDGDVLTYKWWQYPDANTYKGSVDIRDDKMPQAASLIVPKAALDATI